MAFESDMEFDPLNEDVQLVHYSVWSSEIQEAGS